MGSVASNAFGAQKLSILVAKSQTILAPVASLFTILFHSALCESPNLQKCKFLQVFSLQWQPSSWLFSRNRSIFFSHSSVKISSWLVWLGFCFSPQFLAHRRLGETAGLDSDPCTCSWDKPKQGYLSCVYTQTLVPGRQLSQCGQWTVLVPNLRIIHFY